MYNIKIGIIKETKVPVDNRVLFSPEQMTRIARLYPNVSFKVESSDVRVIRDEEYVRAGFEVSNDLSDCDYLLGIKEAKAETLIPHKHYFFFGHVAKQQPYNRELFKTMLERRVTFTDYEYLVDDNGRRLCAFGYWAGVVGVYNTLRLYGLKYGCYNLPITDVNFTYALLIERLKSIRSILDERRVRIVVTGNGRVARGAMTVLNSVGIAQVEVDDYLAENNTKACYCQVLLKDCVARGDDGTFDREDFRHNPKRYVSRFDRFATCSDVLISCHYWDNDAPVYMSADLIASDKNRIRVIGDVTMDIKGSIASTIRAATHAEPFYDVTRDGLKEVPLFEDLDNISVEAVDTLPNALPREASAEFGDAFIEHIIPLLATRLNNDVLCRATIVENGMINAPFDFLADYGCVNV